MHHFVRSSLGEERTLFVSMVAESAGFIALSYARGLPVLIAALTLIAIGYGLAVPCLTTLFANVPVEQGVMQVRRLVMSARRFAWQCTDMLRHHKCLHRVVLHMANAQGIAGFIDRFGQAFGPILGGLIYRQLGAANLMLWTGFALAAISGVCLTFIGDGCAAWTREACCYRGQGYQQVGMVDDADVEDTDIGEVGEESFESDGQSSSSVELFGISSAGRASSKSALAAHAPGDAATAVPATSASAAAAPVSAVKEEASITSPKPAQPAGQLGVN